jgi:Transposase DDE domain
MSTFDLEVCRRLPLADAAFRLLDFVTDDAALADIFARFHGRSYQDVIRFPLFVHLIGDALFGHRGSAHQTFRRARQDGALDACVEAVYGKLQRVPLGLAQGFFLVATERLSAVLPAARFAVPASLQGFRLLRFDGKKLKHVLKRLKPLRGLKGHAYGGKQLVVQDMATEQAVAFAAAADGEVADNPLLPAAVAQVRGLGDPRTRVWVGDRAFCDFQALDLLSADGDHFVVRYHRKCQFHPDPTTAPRVGTDAQGRPDREEWGWLGAAKSRHRRRVRRITLDRPDAEPVVVVTDLTDADAYPAADVLALYRQRWGIERMFLRVTQTFGLRHLIGGTPRATVFQAAFCLLMYNITVAVQGYVAVAAGRSPETISLHLFFQDLVRQLTAWVEVLSVRATDEVLAVDRRRSPEGLRQYLHERLGGVWTERWQKAPTRKRPPKGPPRAYLKGGHSSVAKILNGEHVAIPIPSRKKPKPTPPAAH